MKRFLLAAVAAASLVALAGAAGAASVSISSDKATYNVGETIVLTVTADAEGGNGQVISMTVLHDTALMTGSGVVGPVAPEDGESPDVFTQGGGFATANRGGLEGTCGGIFGANGCNAFDQVFGSANVIDSGDELSILEYTATATGVANFGFRTDGGGGSFNFLGLDGTTITHSVTIIPEPTPALLLGLGLLGLGLLGLALGSRASRPPADARRAGR